MPSLKIQVGVGLAANPAAVFDSIPQAARKAATKAGAEFDNIGKKAQGVYRTSAREAERSADDWAKAQEKAAKKSEKAWDAFYKNQKKWAEDAAKHNAESNLRMAQNAGRFFSGGVRTAGRFALDIARGAGVNLDVGALVGKGVANQSSATRIANYGYVEGEAGAAGKRQDPRAILAEAHAAANAAAMDTGDALEGLSRFVKKSSDLATGRALLADLAKYAKATGSDFGDVADAAGDIAKKLGDVPDKAEKVKSIMMVLAKQGKLGAIDMSDMASIISTMISPANRFAEGSAKSMVELGTALQIAKGYSKGPAQAATSVANFAGDLTSKAGLKGLKGAGFKDEDIFSDATHTKVRNVEDIIVKALTLTGGKLEKISATFSNKRSAAVLNAFNDIYAKAGGGAAGADAIRNTFKQYGAGTSDKDIQDALGREMATTASHVQLLNNKLEETAEAAAGKVLPALERLAPDLVTAADALAKFTVWVAENPKTAIGALIAASVTASIAKAAIGDAAGKALGTAISRMPAGSFGFATAAITIAAATLSIMKYNETSEAAKSDVSKQVSDTTALVNKALKENKEHGAISKETADALARAGADTAALRAAGKQYENPEAGTLGTVKHGLVKAVSGLTGGQEELATAEGKGEQAQLMAAALDKNAGAIDALAKAIHAGKIKVDVTVHDNNGNPAVDNTNRTGP
jgi:hypothetical protein